MLWLNDLVLQDHEQPNQTSAFIANYDKNNHWIILIYIKYKTELATVTGTMNSMTPCWPSIYQFIIFLSLQFQNNFSGKVYIHIRSFFLCTLFSHTNQSGRGCWITPENWWYCFNFFLFLAYNFYLHLFLFWSAGESIKVSLLLLYILLLSHSNNITTYWIRT